MASATAFIHFLAELFPPPVRTLFSICIPLPAAFIYNRWGFRGAWISVLVSSLSLFLISGPLASISYILATGSLSIVLGFFWRLRAPLIFPLLFGTAVRSLGLLTQFQVASFMLGEDVWQLVISQIANVAEVFRKTAPGGNTEALMRSLVIGLIVMSSFWYILYVSIMGYVLFRRMGDILSRRRDMQ